MVVISPLVSLMVDEVSSLRNRAVNAAISSGSQGDDVKLQAKEKDVKAGLHRLLYRAPEAIFAGDKWRKTLGEPPLIDQIAAVTIDEVHCVYI